MQGRRRERKQKSNTGPRDPASRRGLHRKEAGVRGPLREEEKLSGSYVLRSDYFLVPSRTGGRRIIPSLTAPGKERSEAENSNDFKGQA